MFTIADNNLTEFNEDIHLAIFEEDKDGNPYQCGMVDECNVTILFDDLSPPAGSVDEFWNPDYSDAMLNNQNGSLLSDPGTEPLSEIYSLAVTPNDQTVIGGAFSTYSDKNNTYTVNGIARLNTDGSLDTTFNSGIGINVHPGNEFIRSIALSCEQRGGGWAFQFLQRSSAQQHCALEQRWFAGHHLQSGRGGQWHGLERPGAAEWLSPDWRRFHQLQRHAPQPCCQAERRRLAGHHVRSQQHHFRFCLFTGAASIHRF